MKLLSHFTAGLTLILLMALANAAVPLPVRADDVNYALQFDGLNDFVTLNRTASIMGPGSEWKDTKTISLWIKPLGASPACATNSVGWCDHIFGDRPRWWGITRGIINNADRIWIWNWDGNSDRLGVEYVAGEWVHISLVHEGGVLRAFKNGVEVGSIVSGTTLQPPGSPTLQLGAVITSPSRIWSYEGLIDEVQIWNVARSAAQIQQDMFRTLAGDEPGLAAYYRMSDGAGLTLSDDSVANWDGTLHDGNGIVPPDGSPPLWVPSDVSTGPNNLPVALDDAVVTDEDEPAVLSVLINDSDPDGDALTVTAAGPAAHGTATTDGVTVTYTPVPDFFGVDSFPYTISDGYGGTAMAQVSITVTPVDDPPVAVDDAATTVEDEAVIVPVLANDSDPDGDALTVTAAGPAAHGMVTTDLGPGAGIIYTPDLNFYGADSFPYTIGDGHGGTATAQVAVTVTPVNDSPAAVDDAATTEEDAEVMVSVLANDSDPDGDALTVTAAGPAAHGTVSTDPGPGAGITYTPNANFFGADSFPYTISDGDGGTATAQVTITVTPVNDDPPVAVDDAATTVEDEAVIVPVLANDSDPDGDALTVTAAGPAAHGTLTTDGATVTYSPDLNFYGADSFPYTIGDGHGGTATAQAAVTVTPVNDSPAAVDDAATTEEDTGVTVPVLVNDSDPDGDALTVTAAGPAAHGMVTTDPGPGAGITYTPNANFFGADSFPYTISDGRGGVATAQVNITITKRVLALYLPFIAAEGDAHAVYAGRHRQVSGHGLRRASAP